MTRVAMHPEATEDPRAMRWIVPAGAMPVVGEICSAPEALGALLADGTLTRVTVEHRVVVVWLRADLRWSDVGDTGRDALATALLTPHAWVPTIPASDDDLLRSAMADVLSGAMGDFIRSHGGRVDVVEVADGRVAVVGCPVPASTALHCLSPCTGGSHPTCGGVTRSSSKSPPLPRLARALRGGELAYQPQ